ncbi:MAG: pyruvate, phosphate dikinase, partial [Spirochaetia bacterium]|nr:pyruvate, phosphate dikinase [Spirochaetia bacterium]
MARYVYFFGAGKPEGKGLGKKLLGGKGANLMEMAELGIPVPPGIILTTEACNSYSATGKFPDGLDDELMKRLADLEATQGRSFGATTKPLLVSVRSGAPVSMPGMMDTILNLGLNHATVQTMVDETRNPRFVYDSYRRFIQMFSDVVLGLDHDKFEHILEKHKRQAGAAHDTDLKAEHLQAIIKDYLEVVKADSGAEFPQDVRLQLRKAVEAVFRSWNTERAVFYRKLNGIPDDLGTAVVVQSMVFGNMGDDSATGVAFTRNPSTGERRFYGEYLLNAQGEDVVAGIRTPQPIAHLEKDMPEAYKELFDIQLRLEKHFGDMQDLEFTIQQKRLYLLQTRSGKRTGVAALRVAIEMVQEGLIDKKAALLQVNPGAIPSLLAPIFVTKPKKQAIADGRLLAVGLNAGPGAASGKVVLDSLTAQERAGRGDRVILVRQETSPEDIMGMESAEGVLTARGGMTSHAAVVARGMNKPCVVGCSALRIDAKAGTMVVTAKDGTSVTLKEGEEISIDGSTGEVIRGLLPTEASEIDQALSGTLAGESTLAKYFLTLMEWADAERRLKVRANADTPRDAKVARAYGAQGIGLCRTEHMFFEGERIVAMRQMILSNTVDERKKALEKLLPYQRADFIGLFEVMDGLPVTIRLLDPPLHEFLPHSAEQDLELSKRINVSPEEIKRRVKSLKEENPMLGHRGCRLGITFPEITVIQARAIMEAAVAVKKKGTAVHPEIMIPLVGHVRELKLQ